jgi:hypothetical protein
MHETGKKMLDHLQRMNLFRAKFHDLPNSCSDLIGEQKTLLDSQIDYEKKLAELVRNIQ